MSTINTGGHDEKVVSLKFENDDFEKNVSKSLDSLEKLNKSIDFTNHVKGGKGLSELTNVVKASDLQGLENGVNRISNRFTNLGIVGVTALQNITNKAVDAGTRLVKSLTIKPISMGFDEYELKMNSVRTIMASTGESIETVDKYLEELNKYADDTIYSFSDMTNNIGKFTNAGVRLKDAVAAIKGVSNEAALSGANAQEASRAMYNFSQALSAGYVKLIDWKSIENANMATKGFKQQLLDTALAMGTVVKVGDDYQTTTVNAKGQVSDLFNATKGYNEALNNQWLTTEVLTKTLRNYSTDTKRMSEDELAAYKKKLKAEGYTQKQIENIIKLGRKATAAAREVTTWSKMVDALQEAVQSGWSRTFELIFGNIKEAKKLWTGINDVVSGFIGNIDNARNHLLKVWKEAGGRTAMLNGIANVLKYIASFLKPIGKAFRDIFQPANGIELAALSIRFEEFTKKLKANKETLNNIRLTFRGLFAVVDLIKDVFVGLVKSIFPATKSVGSFADVILSVTGAIGHFLSNIVSFINSSGVLKLVFSGISAAASTLTSILKTVTGYISAFITLISKHLNKSLGTLLSYVASLIGYLRKNLLSTVTKTWNSLNVYLSPAVSKFTKKLGDAIAALKEFINEHLHLSKLRAKAFDIGNIIGDTGKKLKSSKEGKKVTETFSDLGKNVKEGFSSVFGELGKSFKNLWEAFKELGSEFKKTVTPMFTDIKNFFSDLHLIDKFAKGIDYVTDAIKSFVKSLKEGFHPLKTLKEWLDPSSFIDVAKASDKAKNSYKKFVDESKSAGQNGGSGITWIDSLNEKLSEFEKFASNNPILKFFVDIKDKVVTIVTNLSKGWDNTDTAIDRATGIVKIVAMLKLVKQSNTIVNAAAGTLKNLGGVFESLGKTFTSAQATMSAGQRLMGTMQSTLRVQMIRNIAIAVALLAGSIYVLAKLDKKELLQGAIALGTILTALVVSLKILTTKEMDPKKLAAVALTFVGIGAALLMITGAIRLIASMPVDKLLKSGLAIAGFVGILLLASNKAGSAKNMVGLLAVALAINILAPGIIMMAKLEFDTVVKAGLAIFTFVVLIGKASKIAGSNKVGALTFIGIATAVTVMVPAILVLAYMPFEKALKGAVMLSAVMFALAGAVKIASSGTRTGDVWTITAMAAMVTALAASLLILSLVPAEMLLKSVAALSTVMITLAVASAYAEKAKKGVAIIAGLFVVLSGVLYIISSMPVDKAATALAALSICMISLSAALFIIDKVPAETIVASLGKLLFVMTVLTTFIATIGAIFDDDQVKDLKKAIERGGELLSAISFVLGDIVGKFVGGFISGAATALPAIAARLSEFMKKLKPFLEGASNIDMSVSNGIKNLAVAAAALTGATFVEALNSLPSVIHTFLHMGQTPIETVAENLEVFTTKMQSLSKKKFPEGWQDKISDIGEGIEALGEAASKIPSYGGFKMMVLGVQDLEWFAEDLNDFLPTLQSIVSKEFKFGKKGQQKIQAVADAITSLGEASNKVPESISLKGLLLGVRDLADFGEELVDFAPNLMEFTKQISATKIDKETNKKIDVFGKHQVELIKRAGEAITAMAESADKIPTELDPNNVAAWLSGNKSLKELTKGYATFGKYLPELIKNTDGLKEGVKKRIIRVADIIEEFAKAAGKIQETYNKRGGWGEDVQKMLYNIGTFTSNMSGFAENFKSFATTAGEIDKSDLKAADIVASSIGHVAKAAFNVKQAKDAGVKGGLKKQLKNIGEGVASYAKSVQGINGKTILAKTDKLVESLNKVSKVLNDKKNFKQSALTSVTAYIKGLKVDDKTLEKAETNAKIVRQRVIDTLNFTSDTKTAGVVNNGYKNAGARAVESFGSGLVTNSKNGGLNAAKEKAAKVATTLTKVLRGSTKKGKISPYTQAGIDAVKGFVEGLRNAIELEEVKAAGTAIGEAAYKAAKKALDEQSPSKKMAEVGKFAVMGMTNGLRKYSDDVYNEAYDMGEKSLTGASDGLSGIDDILGNPIIKPVMDLTNIEQGANQIDSLLSRPTRINGALVDSAINRQNGGRTEQMIKDLGTMIQNSQPKETGTVYNIGDVTLDVTKLENATTLEDIVTIFRRAKSMV